MPSKKSKQRALFLIIYTACIGTIILCAQAPIEVGSRDRSSSLPEGEGRAMVLATCVQCHSLGPIVLQRKTATQWERTVRDMIARGAQIHPEEIAPITTYLAQSFGPEAPPPESGEKQPAPRTASETAQTLTATLPEDPAKAILLRSCIECHDLSRITEQRKDEGGWQASVKDMMRLGAKLRPEEVATIVAYLRKNFGRQSPSATGVTSNPGRAPISSGMGEDKAGDLSRLLPDREGKALILASCTQCHGLQEIVGQRKDAEGWKHTVHDMVSRGAQVIWSEAELITRYLTENLKREK